MLLLLTLHQLGNISQRIPLLYHHFYMIQGSDSSSSTIMSTLHIIHFMHVFLNEDNNLA